MIKTGKEKGSRRPRINNLYDVFLNIAEDEGCHVATMKSCQDKEAVLRSPNTEAAILTAASALSLIAFVSSGQLESINIDDFLSSLASTTPDFMQTDVSTSELATDISNLENVGAQQIGISIGLKAFVDNFKNSAEEGNLILYITRILSSIRF